VLTPYVLPATAASNLARTGFDVCLDLHDFISFDLVVETVAMVFLILASLHRLKACQNMRAIFGKRHPA
jgi:hypothetical protein